MTSLRQKESADLMVFSDQEAKYQSERWKS